MIRANVANGGGYEVNYFLTDHLDSVRGIVDGGGVVKERNDYYSFGVRYVRGDCPQLADNRYKCNGKKEQVMGELDYGVRMYDSGFGKWLGVDPMTEDYFNISSYAYCNNVPVIFIDINGEFTCGESIYS